MSRRRLLVVLLASACSPTPRADTPSDASAEAGAAPVPADSLVLRGPGDVEVWFTDARQATSPDGVPCLERALEVRAGGVGRGVPLLYTREAPTLLGDDAMRAVLYNSCTAGAAYRVDFATISPKRLTP